MHASKSGPRIHSRSINREEFKNFNPWCSGIHILLEQSVFDLNRKCVTDIVYANGELRMLVLLKMGSRSL